MVIEELISVMTPPAEPVDSSDSNDWGTVTNQYGEPLPTDFMQFIDRFGSGTINSYITVFNPFSGNLNLNLFHQTFVQLNALRAIRTEFPSEVPFALFFEPGGLLPWGISIDGDVYCWLTNGISGRWQVVVICRHGGTERFEMSMTQFLARLIKGEITSMSVHDKFTPENGATFEPYEI